MYENEVTQISTHLTLLVSLVTFNRNCKFIKLQYHFSVSIIKTVLTSELKNRKITIHIKILLPRFRVSMSLWLIFPNDPLIWNWVSRLDDAHFTYMKLKPDHIYKNTQHLCKNIYNTFLFCLVKKYQKTVNCI